MKTLGFKTVIFLLILCLTVPTVSVNAADNAISLSLSCGGDSYVGGEARIRITVSKPSAALAGLEFTLKYDVNSVSPLYTENTEDGREMDSLVVKKPDGWEQMSFHSESGYYHFRFAMSDSGNSYLDLSGELVLEIPFAVKKAGSFDFVIEDSDIIAVAADAGSTLMAGTGGSITVTAVNEAQKLSAELIGNATASENGTYYLKIKVTNLGDTAGIIALQFALKYDKALFAPKITKNDQAQMNVFMTEMPQNNWEQMCSLDEKSGVYILRFAAATAESVSASEKLTSGSSLTVTVPFNTVAKEGDVGGFSINGESVLALNNVNGKVSGSGSSISVSVGKGTEGIIPEYLGYTVENGYLCYVSEKTSVGEFLSELNGFYLTDRNGNEITEGDVCTGHLLTDGTNSYIIAVLGDANGSGTVDTYDYILAKRIYFKTFSPNELQQLTCDVNRDKTVDQYDYILIKRHYFGTYVIQ